MNGEKKKIRVLVVDDHDQVRGKLISLLTPEKDIQVVGGACHGGEALQKTRDLAPDVVLMDVKMSVMDGIEATREITSLYPHVRVLALSQHDQDEYVRRMMRSGASGYVLKSYAAEELKPAIRIVHAGGHYFSAAFAGGQTADLRAEKSVTEPGEPVLTRTEREVLSHLASRLSTGQIADILHVEVRSVEFHKANLIEKTGAKDADGLIRYAIDHHITGLDPGANFYEVEHQGR